MITIYPENYILTKDGLLLPSDLLNHRLSLVPINTITNQRNLLRKNQINYTVGQLYDYKLVSFDNNMSFVISADCYISGKTPTVGDKLIVQNRTWSGSKNDKNTTVAKMPRSIKRVVESMKGIQKEDFYRDIGVNMSRVISGQQNKNVPTGDIVKPSDLYQYSSANVQNFLDGFFSDSTEVSIENPEYLGVQVYLQILAMCQGTVVDVTQNTVNKTDKNSVVITAVEEFQAEGYKFDTLNLICNGIPLTSSSSQKTRGFGT